MRVWCGCVMACLLDGCHSTVCVPTRISVHRVSVNTGRDIAGCTVPPPPRQEAARHISVKMSCSRDTRKTHPGLSLVLSCVAPRWNVGLQVFSCRCNSTCRGTPKTTVSLRHKLKRKDYTGQEEEEGWQRWTDAVAFWRWVWLRSQDPFLA